MRYCPNCDDRVETKKDFSVAVFLIGLLLFGLPGLLYLAYYILFKDEKCTRCGVDL